MASKNQDKSQAFKRKKSSISFREKLKIIKMHEGGKCYAHIARDTNRPESTIKTIIRSKDRLQDTIKSATLESTIMTRAREHSIVKVEKLLLIWIK